MKMINPMVSLLTVSIISSGALASEQQNRSHSNDSSEVSQVLEQVQVRADSAPLEKEGLLPQQSESKPEQKGQQVGRCQRCHANYDQRTYDQAAYEQANYHKAGH